MKRGEGLPVVLVLVLLSGAGEIILGLQWRAWPVVVIGVGVLAAGGVLLVLELRVRRWNRRFRAGQCPHCGYDLRASPNRCPECGAEPPNGTAEEFRAWLRELIKRMDPEE